MQNDKFINFGKVKVIIITASSGEGEFNFHHNVLIKNNTTFEEYYNEVKDIINEHYEHGYKLTVVNHFIVSV